MNWKEFFKLDRKKLVTFAIIFTTISLMSSLISTISMICHCPMIAKPNVDTFNIFNYIILISSLTADCSYACYGYPSSFMSLGTILNIILSYIISCFVIHIFNKVKKK